MVPVHFNRVIEATCSSPPTMMPTCFGMYSRSSMTIATSQRFRSDQFGGVTEPRYVLIEDIA